MRIEFGASKWTCCRDNSTVVCAYNPAANKYSEMRFALAGTPRRILHLFSTAKEHHENVVP
jgi:hypothetical protein